MMRKSNYNDDDDEDYDEIIQDLVLAVQEGRYDIIHTTFQRPFHSPPPIHSSSPQRSNHSHEGKSRSNSRAQLYYLSADLTDRDGCSLLQWAAINNRRQIASYLLSRATTSGNSTIVNYSGGVLQETSLQWALRKKYYAMMDLLYQHGTNLSHKSAQGTDALHIACRSGIITMLYQLL
jgi:ankyrin repeat protein